MEIVWNLVNLPTYARSLVRNLTIRAKLKFSLNSLNTVDVSF